MKMRFVLLLVVIYLLISNVSAAPYDTWTQINASAGWSARYGHTSVAMPDGSIVLMGGGSGIGGCDVWRSINSGTIWTQTTAAANWSSRTLHTSVVMPDGSIVLMGGYTTSALKNDVWQSTNNGATWTQINANAGWSGRYHHTSVTTLDGSIVLMGGYSDVNNNDVWRSINNGTTWTQINASAGWSARFGHTSVVLPDGSIVLMGGYDGSTYKNDVWRSIDNGVTWIRMTTTASWAARRTHTSVVVSDGSIVLMGGFDNNFNKNDVWRSPFNTLTSTFITNTTTGIMPLIVQFNDTSSNSPTGWVWNFTNVNGNNIPFTFSTTQNPTYTFAVPGNYTIKLKASNSYESNISTQITWINVSPLIANFSGTPTSGNIPLNVVFSESSTGIPDAWYWEFGDGSISISQNPTHQYIMPGSYAVNLRVMNGEISDWENKTGYITISESDYVNFTATPTDYSCPINVYNKGVCEVDVTFTDTTYGLANTYFNWSFGDNTWFNTSDISLRNPTHKYGMVGTYSPSLYVTNTTVNASAIYKLTKVDYIHIGESSTGGGSISYSISNDLPGIMVYISALIILAMFISVLMIWHRPKNW